MYNAIIYRIQGPRSLTQAADKFNMIDHADKIYDRKSSIGVYVKHTIGKDFAVKSLTHRDGVDIDKQVSETTDTHLMIHIPISATSGKDRIFNAVLICEEKEDLMRPVYLVALDDTELPKEEDKWINIEISLNKLHSVTNETENVDV